MITIFGSGRLMMTPSCAVRKLTGRPQPTSTIGPITIEPGSTGKTASRVSRIAGAAATGSSGNMMLSSAPAGQLGAQRVGVQPVLDAEHAADRVEREPEAQVDRRG